MTIRTLVVLRHAAAEPHSVNGDHGRALSVKGVVQARELGRRLAHYVPHVDVAVISDALRTRQTFDLVRMSIPVDEHWEDRSIYMGSPGNIIDLVRTLAGSTVMVVGHEPTVSSIGSYLARDSRDLVEFGIPTATALVLRFEGAWEDLSEESCSLTFIHQPRS